MITITSDDILGKEVVDPDGKMLGIAIKLHIDSVSKQITGLTIDSGLMKPDIFIGINYIKKFGVDTILLEKTPMDKIKGLRVLTSNGIEIGVVKDVNLFRIKLKDITVISGGAMRKETFKISANDIDRIGGSVILKHKYKTEKLS